jgi:hypothetical protein
MDPFPIPRVVGGWVQDVMETLEAYLIRKNEELGLLNSFLGSPLTIRRPASVAEVIDQKFRLAAALKAEHDLHDWTLTETAWAHSGRQRSAPFEFKYDYQRADLEVRGPSFYSMENGGQGDTVYTASGMAAISALLMASARVLPEADIFMGRTSYGETIELIDSYARHLTRVDLAGLPDRVSRGTRSRVLLIDSCAPASGFEATLRHVQPGIDLVIFDTTCFAGGSRRIGRVLRRARTARIPVVMVRSHNKLDSLGVEYGRLGSAVFIESPGHREGAELLQRLRAETHNAIRLFGGAALPAHFPPYVGGDGYRRLTDRRVAMMLRNSRRMAQHFSTFLADLANELHFAHGLYVTLAPAGTLDENEARNLAAEMGDDLKRAGLPLRHAGSFGFDFGATEWCFDRARDRYVVRLAVPDLPTSAWDEVTRAVATRWAAHERKRTRATESATLVST